MDDTKNHTDLSLKKYTSHTGVKKIHKKILKKEQHAKGKYKAKSKKQINRDIIPINRTKKRKIIIGGAPTPTPVIKPIAPNPVELKTGLPHPIQMDADYITTENRNISFARLAKAKKNEFKRMIFKKKTLEGQITYLEYMYYLLMVLWQRMYNHIRPTEPDIKGKIYKTLIGILQSNTSAFNLHMANGIQVADYSTLSVGTNKETYYDIVYSLSMMRRNTRENFLAKCDKQFVRFLKGALQTGAKSSKEGIKAVFKLSKAVVQAATFVKTKSGMNTIKDLYGEIFNANATLPQSRIAIKNHQNKVGFICALFRFRRDQLAYNYHLDKFIVRLKKLFSTPEAQLAFLNGNHSMLYGNDSSSMSKYSINAITMNTGLTNLSKFKGNSDLADAKSSVTTDDISNQILAKLDSLAKELGMGNYHKLYLVIGDNDKIYYDYKLEGEKQVKTLKQVFKYSGTETKKTDKRTDAQYIAIIYRIYHMLYHLYPNIARIMSAQEQWLRIYGLPKFEELSYHKKKYKAIRASKEYESDYYRYTQSLNTVSGIMSQDITQLMTLIDDTLMSSDQLAASKDARFYRNIINFLHDLEGQIKNAMDVPTFNRFVSDFKNELQSATAGSPATPEEVTEFGELDTPYFVTITNDYNANVIPDVKLIFKQLFSSNTADKGLFLQLIQKLLAYYQNKLAGETGMTRTVQPSKDDESKIYKALGLSVQEAQLRGGSANIWDNEPEWDGTDESLDLINHYKVRKNMSAGAQIGGGLNIIPEDVGGVTVKYCQFSQADLKKYYTYLVDFINSPHFIGSGSKFDKILYSLSLTGSDKGEGKSVGQESMFMEINYFNYLIKFEMGVLNFDDDSGDSNIPLGTNLCRVASGLPLFYETYLVNHFTNISDEPFISRNNYSRIGYTLADPKINKIFYNAKEVYIYNSSSDAGKYGILATQFANASKAGGGDDNDEYRKIPFTLVELATMTPEELLSLSSLASNAELSKLLNTKVENAMNNKLSSNLRYLEPLKKFIQDSYGDEYYFGNMFGVLNDAAAPEQQEKLLNIFELDKNYATTYPTLSSKENRSGLKALAQVFKLVLCSTELQDKTKSAVSRFMNVASKTVGVSLFAGLISGGILTIPAGLYAPWIASSIYKYKTFESAWNAFTEIVSKESTGWWDNIKQALGGAWSIKEARVTWQKIKNSSSSSTEIDFIKADAQGLYNVYRELKMNMFYTNMVKDEKAVSNAKVNAEVIMQNLAYLGILTADKAGKSIKRTHFTLPAYMPNWVQSASSYAEGKSISAWQKESATLSLCSKLISENVKSADDLTKFVAQYILWQFDYTDGATDGVNKLFADIRDTTKQQTTYNTVVENIFTDSLSDEYGMQIFNALKDKTIQPLEESGFEGSKLEQKAGGLVTGTLGVLSDLLPLSEAGNSMKSGIMSTWDSLARYFNTNASYKTKFIETMNIILGIHKYIECLNILGKDIKYVKDSLARTENLFSRDSNSGKKETIAKELIKTGYNDFAMLLINGNFNGLLTSSIAQIGETGMINLIQYYRNLLMDIMNTEGQLSVIQGSKEEVRQKFNKVLTKILVFLRLNALFTDYILMNGNKKSIRTDEYKPVYENRAEVFMKIAHMMATKKTPPTRPPSPSRSPSSSPSPPSSPTSPSPRPIPSRPSPPSSPLPPKIPPRPSPPSSPLPIPPSPPIPPRTMTVYPLTPAPITTAKKPAVAPIKLTLYPLTPETITTPASTISTTKLTLYPLTLASTTTSKERVI